MSSSSVTQPVFSVVAGVYCVHNRQKRQVTELEFDSTKEKVHLCSCCENLFTRPDDVPHFCPTCGGKPVFPIGGPLPEPHGVVG